MPLRRGAQVKNQVMLFVSITSRQGPFLGIGADHGDVTGAGWGATAGVCCRRGGQVAGIDESHTRGWNVTDGHGRTADEVLAEDFDVGSTRNRTVVR